MLIRFLGATRTTTGSMYLLEVNERRLLLECGLFQGRREDSIERNRRLPFKADLSAQANQRRDCIIQPSTRGCLDAVNAARHHHFDQRNVGC